MNLYTIGFTKKSAEQFFTALTAAGIKRLIDVRLNNTSQLAGFSKRDDLRYFLQTIGAIDYLHLPELAPTQALLDAYKKNKGDWSIYESEFRNLLDERAIESSLQRDVFENACLLCSEEKPLHCHRRLVAEYLQEKWGGIDIVHL